MNRWGSARYEKRFHAQFVFICFINLNIKNSKQNINSNHNIGGPHTIGIWRIRLSLNPPKYLRGSNYRVNKFKISHLKIHSVKLLGKKSVFD